jgi:HEAT repeat protein
MTRFIRRHGRVRLVLVLLGFSAWFTVYGDGEMTTIQPSSRVLSADFATAHQALTESIDQSAVAQVGAALESPFLEIKLQAAEALGRIGDKTTVPALIKAMEDNQAYYTGGSETRTLQMQLNAALVAALQKSTGIDLGAIDPESTEDINRVLQISREWQEKNP